MSEVEKLSVLLPHWMEHNDGHEAECTRWARIAREAGKEKVAACIDAAIKAMRESNIHLAEALKEVDGKDDHHQHHDHHHHHHSHE